jgi:hypothetical protein
MVEIPRIHIAPSGFAGDGGRGVVFEVSKAAVEFGFLHMVVERAR